MQLISKDATLVFLHGFLGNHHDYDDVIKSLPVAIQKRCLSVDLPGHNNNKPADYYESVTYLRELLKNNHIEGDFWLYGYATGGRIAIHYAFSANDPHLKGLFIESASFGISDEERKLRKGKDLMWATQFAFKKPEEILRNWYDQPRFDGMTDAQKEMIIRRRKSQDFKKLAVQFDLTSVAHMANFRDRLDELPLPVVYLFGGRDEKFRDAAKREESFSNFKAYEIPQASHNIHYFFPHDVARIISCYLEQ